MRGFVPILRELNRVIDLYRYAGNAYYMQNITVANIDSYLLLARIGDEWKTIEAGVPSFVHGDLSAEITSANSLFNKYISAGTNIPHYFTRYLDARRDYFEADFRRLQLDAALALDGACRHLLGKALPCLPSTRPNRQPPADAIGRVLDHLHANALMQPRQSRKALLLDVALVWERRDRAMHGHDFQLSAAEAGEVVSALHRIMDAVFEIDLALETPASGTATPT
jgi:hypothetical protein